MQTVIENNGLTWLNIKNPSQKDVKKFTSLSGISPGLAKELTTQSQRSRADNYFDHLHISLHVPLYDRHNKTTNSGEVNIILTEKNLITVHQGENLPIKAILKRVKQDTKLQKGIFEKGSDYLLFYLIEELLNSCLDKLDHINEKIDLLEKEIFEENKKSMIKEITRVKRDILSFRRILKPQKNVLEELAQIKSPLLKNNFYPKYSCLINLNIRVWNSLENTKEALEAMEETNNLIASFNLNQTIRFLSAISLITFLLSVTTGIFSMLPFEAFSLSQNPLTFWLIIVFMAIISLLSFIILKKKNWL